MKRKTLIIAVSILLLGIFLCVAYYYFYFKKGVIYDLVNIEFSGISPVETSAIKITGITPVNKKIAIDIHRKIESHDIPGYYQSIEIVVPDTLISKITSIHTTLKGKVYTYKINDLHSIASSPNAHIYVLPPEVKSEQTFFNKLFSAYPFNLVLQVFNVVSSISNIVLSILLYITGILLIIFCIVFVWKFIADILQKSFIKNFITFLQEKKIKYFLLFITFIILSAWPILCPNQIKIIYFLVILLYFSIVVQSIFRIKRAMFYMFFGYF